MASTGPSTTSRTGWTTSCTSRVKPGVLDEVRDVAHGARREVVERDDLVPVRDEARQRWPPTKPAPPAMTIRMASGRWCAGAGPSTVGRCRCRRGRRASTATGSSRLRPSNTTLPCMASATSASGTSVSSGQSVRTASASAPRTASSAEGWSAGQRAAGTRGLPSSTAGSYARTIAPSLREQLHHVHGGRLAHVLGAALERQAPHRDDLVLERAEARPQPADRVGPLRDVDLLDGRQHRAWPRRTSRRCSAAPRRPWAGSSRRTRCRDGRSARPMRGSYETPSTTWSMLVPISSHRRAISLMNEMRVARNEFATYLIISAVRRSVTIVGAPRLVVQARDRERVVARLRADDDPVGMEEVPHRVALAQELGVRDDPRRPVLLGEGLAEDALDRLARPDRRGALVDDDRRRPVEVRRRSTGWRPGGCGGRRHRPSSGACPRR